MQGRTKVVQEVAERHLRCLLQKMLASWCSLSNFYNLQFSVLCFRAYIGFPNCECRCSL